MSRRKSWMEATGIATVQRYTETRRGIERGGFEQQGARLSPQGLSALRESTLCNVKCGQGSIV